MKYRVALDFHDKYLKRKIELILADLALFAAAEDAEIIFTDSLAVSGDSRKISVGKTDEYSLKLPFTDGELLSLLPKRESKKIALFGTRVFLGDEEIKLTELEFSLLSRLLSGGGDFVSREELSGVFADAKSASMLNVYIHYLREKLERDGARIILSSRKSGYKIDRKFIDGGAE